MPVYYGDDLVASHLRVAAGRFAPEPGKQPVTSSQKAYVAKLLGRWSESDRRFERGPTQPTSSAAFKLSA